MSSEFVPLGLQSPEQIQSKLQEIEGADYIAGMESAKRPWLYTQHQYGYIAPFVPGTQRYHPITSASNMSADDSLIGQRINIRLDHLRVYMYPTAWFNWAHNVHNILFTFEACNQLESGREEPVAFNKLYRAHVGQDAAVTGQPVFIGLTVGKNGVGFACRTVNVTNSTDEKLVSILESDTVTKGLQLLTTAQPALGPLSAIARGMCISLIANNRNVPVQEVSLGLDFENGRTGVRIAEGSYVVAQTSRADEIEWSSWVYDADIGTILRSPSSLNQGETPYPLPYNCFVFRISLYTQ